MPRSSMEGRIRRDKLANILRKQENVSTAELAEQFQVSEMTIRRDLKQLQEEGIAVPCYGGAMAAQRITFEFDFEEHRRLHLAEKRRIGEAAVTEISTGQTLFLDTGTTSLELAKAISRENIHITIITTSLVVASELWARPNIRLQLLGGDVRVRSPDLVGPLTEIMLDRLSADIAFLGSDGIDPDRGSFGSDVETARICERMCANAKKVVVISDSSKLGRVGAARYIKTEDIDLLITDTAADPKLVKRLNNQGVEVKRV